MLVWRKKEEQYLIYSVGGCAMLGGCVKVSGTGNTAREDNGFQLIFCKKMCLIQSTN